MNNHGKTSQNFAVIDFESDPFKHGRIPQAFAVGFFDGACYEYRWGTHDHCVSWAAQKCRRYRGIIYAHNGGKFDFLAFLLAGSGKTLWGEPINYIGGRLVRCQYGAAELRDSYAILPAPLRAYDKGEVSYHLFEKNHREKHRTRILAYLRRDCLGLHALISSFVQSHSLSSLTAAGAGMKYAKSLGISIESLNEKQDANYRRYYSGGLVLARKPGIHRGYFSLYDIRSAYPHAMLAPHPASSRFTIESSPVHIHPQGFYTCEGSANECFQRVGLDGVNTLGGEGLFRVTGWELACALRWTRFSGTVVMGEIPERTTDFKIYVDHFFEQKDRCEQEGDKAGRLIAKIMLNSLYGKFAQNPEKYRNYWFMPVAKRYKETAEANGFTLESILDAAQLEVWSRPADSHYRYNVATAASITGYVRARLYQAIYETSPYYLDTDSIICDAHRKPSGVSPGLGGWCLEIQGDLLYIAGKKLYALRILQKYANNSDMAKKAGLFWDGQRGWKIASKGCRLTPDEMKRLCQGKTVDYKNDAPTYSLLNNPRFVHRSIKATSK